ncbi:PAS domain-containing sensor histidine kinase [Flavobacterium succinicans]|uniref:histidine kinase n=1 Tax=Flavobacterium succinicans TaxID=29536 RepID=A0A199XS30_9FLAO|nr:PAS domain-containing sensor histidine kinase [Flavobacterium succinicans]OAZ04568.1 signal transduction histidine-protein kinase BarA [Flavobacterium succinicans]
MSENTVMDKGSNDHVNYVDALNSYSVVSIVNPEGYFINVNNSFCNFYKYTSEEIIGKHFDQICASSDVFIDFFHNFYRNNDKDRFCKVEFLNTAKDGEHYWFDSLIVPFRNVKKEIYQYVIVQYDITDKVNIVKGLEQQNQNLCHQNEHLSRIINNLSHDLRSPLLGILGFIMLIEEGNIDMSALEYLKLIKESIFSLDNHIVNVINYSKNITCGLEIKKISLHKTIESVIESVKYSKGANQINFLIEVSETEPFYSDKLRLESIINNIVSNAIKYCDPDNLNKNIKIMANVESDIVSIVIEDNGIGIPYSAQRKVFDKYFKVAEDNDGFGLGLFIVKDAVESLGGSIDLKSQEGKGSTFCITLKNYKNLVSSIEYSF